MDQKSPYDGNPHHQYVLYFYGMFMISFEFVYVRVLGVTTE